MNNKKKTIILIALFIILMVSASVLYNNLSANYKMDSLTVEDNAGKVTNTNNSDSSDNASVNADTSNAASNSSQTETNSSGSSESSDPELTQAPNFTVYNLDGNEVNLSDFFGKPIIVNFWASWCGPCKMEMPDFNEAHGNYKDDITFLMVNMTDGSRETVEVASSFIEEQGYTFPVYYDTSYSAAITYSVSSLPTTYFINAEGKLIAYTKGAINGAILQKGIDMIYSKE